METRGLVLWQPFASLCLEVNPDTGRPYKTIETRGYAWPSTVPLPCRVLIFAAKKGPTPGAAVGPWRVSLVRSYSTGRRDLIRPIDESYSEMIPLPLGAVLGSVTVTESLPMSAWRGVPRGYGGWGNARICPEGEWQPRLIFLRENDALAPLRSGDGDITDQLPFGDFTPGRFGWLLADPVRLDQPITEYCCGGFAGGPGLADGPDRPPIPCVDGRAMPGGYRNAGPCRVCKGSGRVPVRGKERVFIPPAALVEAFDRAVA